eukprot:8249-Heterococcus_DN1.PRE.1
MAYSILIYKAQCVVHTITSSSAADVQHYRCYSCYVALTALLQHTHTKFDTIHSVVASCSNNCTRDLMHNCSLEYYFSITLSNTLSAASATHKVFQLPFARSEVALLLLDNARTSATSTTTAMLPRQIANLMPYGRA